MTDHPQTGAGIITGATGIAKNMAGLLLARIELAALEISEVRDNLFKLLSIVALTMITLWFAIACWTAVIICMAWETFGWKILPLLAVAFTVCAAGLFLYLCSVVKNGKLSMPATMNELHNDRHALMEDA